MAEKASEPPDSFISFWSRSCICTVLYMLSYSSYIPVYTYKLYIAPSGRVRRGLAHTPFFQVVSVQQPPVQICPPTLSYMEITGLLWWMARFWEIWAGTGSPERRKEDRKRGNERESQKDLWRLKTIAESMWLNSWWRRAKGWVDVKIRETSARSESRRNHAVSLYHSLYVFLCHHN